MKVPATPLVLLIGALWVAITGLGLFGMWFPALLLSVALMTAHLVLGSAHSGRIRPGLLIYPILTWALVWLVSFVFAEVFARSFAGQEPPFTVAGLHPSFAWIVFGYWLGGVATLTIGFSRRRKMWMTDEQWSEFTARIAGMNTAREEAEGGSDH